MLAMKHLSPLLLFGGLWLVAHGAAIELGNATCRDESGQHVDWYYMYKLPKHYGRNHDSDRSGLLYMYVTSRSYDQWQMSAHGIDSAQSMPAQLQPLFDDPNVLVVAYNDEFPNGTVTDTGGHAKGVLATDGVSAVWLIHSVPKYPNISTYEYPHTAHKFGQSFLCLTLPVGQLEKVSEQLTYIEPHIYDAHVPDSLRSKFPTLNRVLQHRWRAEPPYHNRVLLRTLGGATFESFAKSPRVREDLYQAEIAPALDADLLVEAWVRGGDPIVSICNKGRIVYNVQEIGAATLDINFNTTADHSKWAVSKAVGWKLWRWRLFGNDWICVGDMNHQWPQLKRGGGSVCANNGKVAELYRNMILRYDNCD